MKLQITALDIAAKFLGLREVAGHASSPQVLSMLQLDSPWVGDDETAWCSAFVNYICWLLGLPRSKNLAARSWLAVGDEVYLDKADVGFDVVILSRGDPPQPGPSVLAAPGHVGFFAGYAPAQNIVHLLGGNQGDAVTVAPFDAKRILGIRRLVTDGKDWSV